MRTVEVVEMRTLTRENFDEVGEWAGATECWGLDAPFPAIHLGSGFSVSIVGLGDTVALMSDGSFIRWTWRS